MRLVVGGALGFAFAWTAEAAVTPWFVVWPGFWVGEFLIVEIRLLHDNRVPSFEGSINIHQSTMAYWAVD